MVTTEPLARRYSNHWYSISEAQKIETYLRTHSATGDNWNWIDRNGDTCILSGTSSSDARDDYSEKPVKNVPVWKQKLPKYLTPTTRGKGGKV